MKKIMRRGKSEKKVQAIRNKTNTWQSRAFFIFTWTTFPLHCHSLLQKSNFSLIIRFCHFLLFLSKMAYKSLDSITRSDIESLGISGDVAAKLLLDLDEIIRHYGSATTPPETWIQISRRILHPNLPFSFHQMMYYGCYKDFGPDPPAWIPDPYVISPSF